MMPKTSTPTLGAAGFSGMPSPTGAAACYIHLELQLDVGDAQEPAVERSPGSPRLYFSSYSLLFFCSISGLILALQPGKDRSTGNAGKG